MHPEEHQFTQAWAAVEVDNRVLDSTNTLANKGNCLRNLPDDPDHPTTGNRTRLREAKTLYGKAQAVFTHNGETDKAAQVKTATPGNNPISIWPLTMDAGGSPL